MSLQSLPLVTILADAASLQTPQLPDDLRKAGGETSCPSMRDLNSQSLRDVSQHVAQIKAQLDLFARRPTFQTGTHPEFSSLLGLMYP